MCNQAADIKNMNYLLLQPDCSQKGTRSCDWLDYHYIRCLSLYYFLLLPHYNLDAGFVLCTPCHSAEINLSIYDAVIL